ncbi:MAG TPA: phosphotransferase [Candidatus Acidoferrales bacterium]|nr:phosphotransferase [Candidatus Acidoferrales bacterium]
MENNAVSGVIDFGDVNWGDPDYDFMYLFVDFGLAFTLDVARRYGHADIGRLQDKLRYYGIVDQIDTIREGRGRSLPGQKEEAWQRLRQLLVRR